MIKTTRCSVSSRTPKDPNYTKQDLNKKYFTDYHSRYKSGNKDYGRKTLYWGINELKYSLVSDLQKDNLRKASIFEEAGSDNELNKKTKDSKDYHKNGVYAHLSIMELVNAINGFSIQNRFKHFTMKQQVNNLKQRVLETGVSLDIPSKIDYKSKGLVISKRLLKGGISAIKNSICNGSPYLFFDIDVKPNENSELYSSNGIPNELNKRVFGSLKEISVLIARSSSGIGICGILYCPSLIGINKNSLHKIIGNAVLEYVNDEFDLPVKVDFDENQSQFTLGRSFPVQFTSSDDKYNWNRVELNENAVEFLIDIKHENIEKDFLEIISTSKTPNNSRKNYTFEGETYNESYNQKPVVKAYNLNNCCKEILLESGIYEEAENQSNSNYSSFQKIGKNNKSVSVSKYNTFKCFTNSLKGKTSFDLLVQLKFEGDSRLAYKSIATPENDVVTIINDADFENKTLIPCDEIDHVLFNYDNWDDDNFFIHPLESLRPYKLDWLNEIIGCEIRYDNIIVSESGEIQFESISAREILAITDRDIEIAIHSSNKENGYDYEIYQLLKDQAISSTIDIKNFITPAIINENCTEFINYIFSGCGCGKTTAFLGKNEPKINGVANENKILFVVPRVVMVEQQLQNCNSSCKLFASTGEGKMNAADGIEYIQSIGANSEKLLDDDNSPKSGILTYDQFVMIPNHIIGEYDYVVFDESHLLASDTFREAIPKSFLKLEQIKELKAKVRFVLLSATPSVEVLTLRSYFKSDFKIINIQKKQRSYPKIYVHNLIGNDRRKRGTQVFNQILKNVNENKKVIIFCENKNKIRTHWDRLEKYCSELGVVSPARSFISADSKELDVYKKLVDKELLNVDVLYATSVLNVGLNISEGVDNGVSFIFDYSTKEGHGSANGQIQLLFRNRKRNTEVHCFSSFMQKESKELFKIHSTAKKYENIEYYFNNMKSSGLYLEKLGLKSYIFEDAHFIGVDSYSECCIATQSLEKYLKNDKNRLDTFIKLAQKHGCSIEYIINTNETSSLPLGLNNTNHFVINVLNTFLSINNGQKINLICKNQSTSAEISTLFVLNKEPLLIEKNSASYECEYHSTFHSILQSVKRSYNTLLYYYKSVSQIKMVLNFILDKGGGKKTIDQKLLDYIKTYKTIHNSTIITAIISKIIKDKDATLDKSLLENTLKTEIPNTIILHFSKTLSVDLIKINSNYGKVINEGEFQNFFREHLVNKVNECFYNLYSIQSTDKKDFKKLGMKHILDCGRHLGNTQDNNDNLLLDFLSFDKNINTLNNDNLYESILRRLSIEYPLDKLNSHIISDYKIDKDYFDTEIKKLSFDSTNGLNLRYKKELDEFKNLQTNKRSKFAYAIINNKTEEIVVKKSMKLLHSELLKTGIINKMISVQQYDYTKPENFYKKMPACENYTLVKKIDLNKL
jgi:hypothetical protein